MKFPLPENLSQLVKYAQIINLEQQYDAQIQQLLGELKKPTLLTTKFEFSIFYDFKCRNSLWPWNWNSSHRLCLNAFVCLFLFYFDMY